jgi:hypothetical protein
MSVPASTSVRRRRSIRVVDQYAASPTRTVQVAVTAVVKTGWTPRVTAVAVWMPTANAKIPSRTISVEPG